MTTCTRVSRSMEPFRPATAEEHRARSGLGPAGPPLDGGEKERWQHEQRPGGAAPEKTQAARFTVGPRGGRGRQKGERDVSGVLPERRRRPANAVESRDLEQASRPRRGGNGHVSRGLG